MYNTVVSITVIVWCEKCSPTLCRYWKTIIDFKTETGFALRRAVFGLSQDRVCTDSFEHVSAKSLKRDQSNDTKFNPPLFSIPLKRSSRRGRQAILRRFGSMWSVALRAFYIFECLLEHIITILASILFGGGFTVHVVPLQQFDTNSTRLQV